MAKKKKAIVEEPVLKKNVVLDDDPTADKRSALIKFDDANVLKIKYSLQNESLTVTNTADGKSADSILGVVKSYVPTLSIKFVIEESLGNESDLNLLKNTMLLTKRDPYAEFQLQSGYCTIEPAATGEFTVDNIVYRNTTGTNFIAYADFANLSGLTVVKSDKVNCTSGDSATVNVTITDPSKDASIVYTLSAGE